MDQDKTRTGRPAPQLMTFAQAGSLAANSPAWWRRQAARGLIGIVKLGRSARLREDEVLRIIAEGSRPGR
jgi:hypothetical protein